AAIVTARGAEVSLLGWMNLAFRLTARPLVALEVSHQNTLLQRSHRKQVAVSIDYEKIYFRELHVAKEG
ncbi:MAG: hypothetical protein ACXWW4_11430, partial [Candidatus Binatia bacterium]